MKKIVCQLCHLISCSSCNKYWMRYGLTATKMVFIFHLVTLEITRWFLLNCLFFQFLEIFLYLYINLCVLCARHILLWNLQCCNFNLITLEKNVKYICFIWKCELSERFRVAYLMKGTNSASGIKKSTVAVSLRWPMPSLYLNHYSLSLKSTILDLPTEQTLD